MQNQVATLAGDILPTTGRVDMKLENGLRFDPHRHEVTETMFGVWCQREFLNPDLFTYRHREHNSWMLAQWLDEGKSMMVEIWGTDPGTAVVSLDELLRHADYEDIKRRIRLATAVRSEVTKLALKRQAEERKQLEAKDLAALEKRASVAKYFRDMMERKEGRLSDATAKHLDDLESGAIPYQPEV